MLFLQKLFSSLLVIGLVNVSVNASAQSPVKEFTKDSVYAFQHSGQLLLNKAIPTEITSAVTIALAYYPELQNTRIEFRIKKQLSPLMARPSMLSIFRRASKRKYIVSISNETDSMFFPILLSNLSFNSQIGVIGHELGHVSDYRKRTGLYFIVMAIGSIIRTTTDRREHATDMRCIAHGLGYQLYSWSCEVCSKLRISHWNGVSEGLEQKSKRYMDPEDILHVMKENKIYE